MIGDAYWNGLFRKNERYARFIERHYPAIFRYINKCIENKTCPVCKRRFSTRFATLKHIHRSKTCAPILSKVIDLIRMHVPEHEILNKVPSLEILVESEA